MRAREFATKHLLREARERVNARGYDTATQRSEAMAKAASESAPVEATIAGAQQSAELCAFIVERFRGEFSPELIAEIGLRGKWKRELAEMARAEGLVRDV